MTSGILIGAGVVYAVIAVAWLVVMWLESRVNSRYPFTAWRVVAAAGWLPGMLLASLALALDAFRAHWWWKP